MNASGPGIDVFFLFDNVAFLARGCQFLHHPPPMVHLEIPGTSMNQAAQIVSEAPRDSEFPQALQPAKPLVVRAIEHYISSNWNQPNHKLSQIFMNAYAECVRLQWIESSERWKASGKSGEHWQAQVSGIWDWNADKQWPWDRLNARRFSSGKLDITAADRPS
jgi:hypothetical protein